MESLEMNNVSNVFVDGTEIYNIYDGTLGSERLIWPKSKRTIYPTISDLSYAFTVGVINGISLEAIDEDSFHIMYDYPRATLRESLASKPEEKNGICVTRIELLVHYTNSTSSEVYTISQLWSTFSVASGLRMAFSSGKVFDISKSGVFYSGVMSGKPGRITGYDIYVRGYYF